MGVNTLILEEIFRLPVHGCHDSYGMGTEAKSSVVTMSWPTKPGNCIATT